MARFQFEFYSSIGLEAATKNDWPIVAVALLLDCPIWTEGANFFSAGIATWTNDLVHLYLSQ
ncbi:MAG: hypothetical protein HC851_05835 [Acaryochloris sp. RU_4_1]|nr:hypothetical protein [Acaryochloris sp. SU_5_25]NJM65212.1 hypothetical protein [Acaryochloris sp. RU_4_1]